ncbi:hypothetical protein PFISCL1PPCAC_20356 [Pristionchus fissidentatus]|uniref:Uncharacterized protein n=1 Tax=Pristionchus fissidentatus TaxID=1538716 RepID=A0AAV5WAP1_9BILA|nr:hypothetical protein PFISCL1PPCAC_20356 [Pristionchus fissidentatus]
MLFSLRFLLVLICFFVGISSYSVHRSTNHEMYPIEPEDLTRRLEDKREVLVRVLKRAEDLQVFRRSQSQNVFNRNRCFFSPVSC